MIINDMIYFTGWIYLLFLGTLIPFCHYVDIPAGRFNDKKRLLAFQQRVHNSRARHVDVEISLTPVLRQE